MKILVIIPAYNEEGCIEGVIKDIRDHFPAGDIVVINDGSQDDTSAIAGRLGVRVVDMPYNLGIGGAMQAGFLYALGEGYDAALQFDGDGQHHADQIE
ncbi:MAG TPA: glycosyltransferase family 2 protein, partial [Dissulfurispiraceae bacterium]|nr:glycosyltransferase family 2 protein [Dissulfurispiraceae bacterium]